MRPTAFVTDFVQLGGPELGPKRWPATGLWMEGPAQKEAVLEVSPSRPQQHVLGFGAALTESAAQVIWSSPEADNILDDLFLPMERGGAGLSCLRVCIGSSDFSLEEGDFDPSRGLDLVVPVLKAAKQRNPDLALIASPWTAPRWMKTSGTFCGGTLKDKCIQSYSVYLLRALLFFEHHQLPIYALTLQNEPSYVTEYPSMKLTANQQAALAKELVRTLRRNGLSTLVLGHDDNYSEVSSAVELLHLAGDVLDGTAWHAYKGTVESLSTPAIQRNGIFFTEQTAHSMNPRSADFAKDMEWMMDHVLLGPLLRGARCGLAWNLALDPAFGPHLRGAPHNCRGVLEVPAVGPHERSPEFFALAHACHACSRGSWRVHARSATPGIACAAFRSSCGSHLGLLVQNRRSSSTTQATVRCGGQIVARLLLPPGSLLSAAGLDLAEALRPSDNLSPPKPRVPVNCFQLAGAMFALKSPCHGTFLAAHEEMFIPFQSDAVHPCDWERWTAVNVAERRVALRSSTGNFLAPALHGSLVLSRSWFDKLTFAVLAMPDGTVAFCSEIGFLQMPEKGTPRLSLSRIGAHEVFTIVSPCRLPRSAFAVRSASTGLLLSANGNQALAGGEAGEAERWLAVKASAATYHLRNWHGTFLGCTVEGGFRQVASVADALSFQPYKFEADVIGFDTADGNLQVVHDEEGLPRVLRSRKCGRERWKVERLDLLPPRLPFTLQAEGGAYLSLVDGGVAQAKRQTPGESETWCFVPVDNEDQQRRLLRAMSGVFLAAGDGDKCTVEDSAEKAMPLEVTSHRDGTIDLVLSVQPRGILVLPPDGSHPHLQRSPQKKGNRLLLRYVVG